ncbi:MAG: hypothetical protein H8D38_06375 [DPANN group archaeon]|nr:hypothetical protein [DPANN group archaeon]
MRKKVLFVMLSLFLISVSPDFTIAGLQEYCLEKYCEPICDCSGETECNDIAQNAFWKGQAMPGEVDFFCEDYLETDVYGGVACDFEPSGITLDLSTAQGRSNEIRYIHGKRVYVDEDTIGQCSVTYGGSSPTYVVTSAQRIPLGSYETTTFSGCQIGKPKKVSSATTQGNSIIYPPTKATLYRYEFNYDNVGGSGTVCGANEYCILKKSGDNFGVCKTIENIEDFTDVFGYFCPGCSKNERNSGTTLQMKFSPILADNFDAWALSTVQDSIGNVYTIYYEPKEWFTSRGDMSNGGVNYYHSGMTECISNFGPGVRVASMEVCNDMGDCVTTSNNYELNDTNLDCIRTSGVVDVVPVTKAKSAYRRLKSPLLHPDGTHKTMRLEDVDVRKGSHLAVPNVAGGVMYNQVGLRVSGTPGRITNKYFTTDSSADSLDNFFDYSFLDKGFILR